MERKVDAGDAVMALKYIEELDFDKLAVSEGPKVVSLIVTMPMMLCMVAVMIGLGGSCQHCTA